MTVASACSRMGSRGSLSRYWLSNRRTVNLLDLLHSIGTMAHTYGKRRGARWWATSAVLTYPGGTQRGAESGTPRCGSGVVLVPTPVARQSRHRCHPCQRRWYAKGTLPKGLSPGTRGPPTPIAPLMVVASGFLASSSAPTQCQGAKSTARAYRQHLGPGLQQRWTPWLPVSPAYRYASTPRKPPGWKQQQPVQTL